MVRTIALGAANWEPGGHADVSVQALSWALEDSQAEGVARLVLLSLANHASARGNNACQGFKTIGREARVSRSTVIRAIEELEELGEVLVFPQHGVQGKGGRTNRYELPMIAGWCPPEDCGEPRLDPCGHMKRTGVTETPVPKLVVSGDGQVVSKTGPSGVTADTQTMNRSIEPNTRVPAAWAEITDWDPNAEDAFS